MPNFVILKWRPLNIWQNFEKISLLFSPKIYIFDLLFKSFEDLQINSNENFKTVQLCPIKGRFFKVFVKLHKSPLLRANIVKGAFSSLRQFLATENH